MSNRLLLLTALLAAPACTVPYPYSPYGAQAHHDNHGYGPSAATTVTEDGTVVVVVIDPAALDQLTADARRTGRSVVQVNIGQGGVREGNDLALSAEHNDGVLQALAAAETGVEAQPQPSQVQPNQPQRGNTGWTRGTGNVSRVSNATPEKTERRVEQPVAQAEPAQPAAPVTTVSTPAAEKPQPTPQPEPVAAPAPVVKRGPVITPGARSSSEPQTSAQPQRTRRAVAGSSWWAPIGLIQKAKGDQ